MSIKVKTIEDVVNYQLCTGCGACASVEPDRYKITDVEQYGRRPQHVANAAESTGSAFAICPGHQLARAASVDQPGLQQELLHAWGPVYEVWEGFALDDEVRFSGSSGGAITALALFALEQKNSAGVLHTGQDQSCAYKNQTKYSKNRQELIGNAGSRYATASPCERLDYIVENENKSVFIGKPCDVAAVHNLARVNAGFADKLEVTIALFCAGVPSTAGNKKLVEKVGLQPEKLQSLNYRGQGWPGLWTAREQSSAGEEPATEQLTYAESWGFLQAFRQWRCYICPDHAGEFADIAIGDPWYRPVQDGESGKSLIVARTLRGQAFLHAAADAGYIKLETSKNSMLPDSQPNLLRGRGNLWGRFVALKMLGAAVPNYSGISFFRYWWTQLGLKEKIQSIVGTIKRIKRKALTQNQNII